MPDVGPLEIIIIAVVILILFGSKKMPDAARSLGRSLRIFKSETRGLHQDEQMATQSLPPAVQTRPAADPGVTLVNGRPIETERSTRDDG